MTGHQNYTTPLGDGSFKLRVDTTTLRAQMLNRKGELMFEGKTMSNEEAALLWLSTQDHNIRLFVNDFMVDWLPISKAPMNGMKLELWGFGWHNQLIGQWDVGKGQWRTGESWGKNPAFFRFLGSTPANREISRY